MSWFKDSFPQAFPKRNDLMSLSTIGPTDAPMRNAILGP